MDITLTGNGDDGHFGFIGAFLFNYNTLIERTLLLN